MTPSSDSAGPMRCQRVHSRLGVYLDDECAPGERRRIETHINSCEECYLELQDRIRLHEMIDAALVDRRGPGDGFVSQVMGDIAVDASGDFLEAPQRQSAGTRAGTLAAGIMLMVGIVLGGLIGQDLSNTLRPPGDMGQRRSIHPSEQWVGLFPGDQDTPMDVYVELESLRSPRSGP